MKILFVCLLGLMVSGCVTTSITLPTNIPRTPQQFVDQGIDKAFNRGTDVLNPIRWTHSLGPHGAYAFGYVWCAAGHLILNAAVTGAIENRELKLSEAYAVLGSCVFPIVGGMIVKAIFAANPQWDKIKMENYDDLRNKY